MMATEARVKCKKKIYGGAWQAHPCSRWAVKDGFCKQHHPDSVTDRREARSRKWKAEDDARARRDGARKMGKIDALCARIEKFADYDERGNRVLVDAILLDIMENGR